MGDPKDHQERSTTSQSPAQDGVVPHRKPLSKGSNGSKPVAHAPGQKPKPKQSGAMYEAHRAHRAAQDLLQGEHPTGFDYIDSGGQGLCAPGAAGAGGAGCFLSKDQRTALNSQALFQVELVAGNYASALVQLKLETLIKKVDELPWYTSLLLGAAITVVESLVPVGIAAFAAAGVVESAIAEAGVQLAKTELTAAEKEMKTLAAAQVSSTIKSAATLGKTAAIKSFTSASSDQTQQANAKVQAMSYADTLSTNGNMMWLKIGHDIGSVDDATALGILKSMDPITMSAAQFHEQLSAQLARYAKSDISKLGREVDYENGKKVEKETRVGRLIPFHGPARLVYMDRVFDGWYRDVATRNAEKTERSGVYDDPRNAFSLSQEADWKIDGKKQRRHEEPLRPDKILNYVEPEFEELAVQKQKDVWLTDVETFRESFVNGQYHLTKVAGA